MTWITLCRTTSLVFALVLGLFTTGIAAADSRPFFVVVEGFAAPTPTADPCVLVNSEHGTGHATHLGAITWTSEETVNLCAGPDGADVAGQMVITAANSDQIFASYETLAQLDFGANQVRALGEFTITGGTGRFADATGRGTIGAEGSLSPPFDVVGSMSGRISY